MRRALLALVLTSGCATAHVRPVEFVEPTYITALGVLVYIDDGVPAGYLSPDIASKLEDDLLEAWKNVGVDGLTVMSCVLGTPVHVVNVTHLECGKVTKAIGCAHTRTKGKHAWTTIELATHGKCAFDEGETGATFVHELTHSVVHCLGLPDDHDLPVWEEISGIERVCP